MEKKKTNMGLLNIGTYDGRVIDFEEALELTGFGKFNVAFLTICGVGFFAANIEMFFIGYILPAAQCDFNLDTSSKGLLTTINFIGMIISSNTWGYIADAKGRKKSIITGLIATTCTTFLASFVSSFWFFLLLRLLSGIFMSGPSTILYAYLGEFHSEKHRTKVISWASVWIGVAIIFLPVSAWIFLSQSYNLNIFGLNYGPWRTFTAISSIPSLIVAIILLWFPESPKFLLTHGKTSEAFDVLRKIYHINTNKTPNKFPVVEFEQCICEEPENEQDSFLMGILKQTVVLFKRPLLYYTSITCSIQAGLFATSSALLLWYPDIVNQLSENTKINPKAAITVCEAVDYARTKNHTDFTCNDEINQNVFMQNLMIGIGYFVGYIIMGFVIDIIGKKTFLVSNLVLSGLCTAVILFITTPIMVDILFVGILVPPGVCVAVVNAAVVDLFPTHVRAMAMSISLTIARIASVVTSSSIGLLLEFNCVGTFAIFGLIFLTCVILSSIIPARAKENNS